MIAAIYARKSTEQNTDVRARLERIRGALGRLEADLQRLTAPILAVVKP